jgi:hypothetical protein
MWYIIGGVVLTLAGMVGSYGIGYEFSRTDDKHVINGFIATFAFVLFGIVSITPEKLYEMWWILSVQMGIAFVVSILSVIIGILFGCRKNTAERMIKK